LFEVDSEEFWRCCTTLRITGGFELCPSFCILKNTKENDVSVSETVSETSFSSVSFRILDDGQSPRTQNFRIIFRIFLKIKYFI
jgi:hypothetical protein